MRVYLHCLEASLRGMRLPFLGALLFCAGLLWMLPPQTGLGADRAAGYWLHLPGLLLVATGLGSALESWPLFSRARPGAGWVLRTQTTPLHGCLVAALGSLTALAIALGCAGVCFALLLGTLGFDLGAVQSRVRFEQGPEFLTDTHPAASFRSTSDTPVSRLSIRPRPLLVSAQALLGSLPAEIRVRADGEPLHPDWIENNGGAIEFEISPPRPIAALTVERRVGVGIDISLGGSDVEGRSSRTHSTTANCVLAILTYLIPATLALTVMILGHTHLNLPVNFAAGSAVLFLTTLLEFTPNTAAVTAFARARWVLGEDVATGTLFTVAAAGVLLIFRSLLDRRRN